eukprot:Gb_08549 [translate_table: standard]
MASLPHAKFPHGFTATGCQVYHIPPRRSIRARAFDKKLYVNQNSSFSVHDFAAPTRLTSTRFLPNTRCTLRLFVLHPSHHFHCSQLAAIERFSSDQRFSHPGLDFEFLFEFIRTAPGFETLTILQPSIPRTAPSVALIPLVTLESWGIARNSRNYTKNQSHDTKKISE